MKRCLLDTWTGFRKCSVIYKQCKSVCCFVFPDHSDKDNFDPCKMIHVYAGSDAFLLMPLPLSVYIVNLGSWNSRLTAAFCSFIFPPGAMWRSLRLYTCHGKRRIPPITLNIPFFPMFYSVTFGIDLKLAIIITHARDWPALLSFPQFFPPC